VWVVRGCQNIFNCRWEKQAVYHSTHRSVSFFISDSAAGMVPTMLLPGNFLLGK
jgi:hypothetical protein